MKSARVLTATAALVVGTAAALALTQRDVWQCRTQIRAANAYFDAIALPRVSRAGTLPWTPRIRVSVTRDTIGMDTLVTAPSARVAASRPTEFWYEPVLSHIEPTGLPSDRVGWMSHALNDRFDALRPVWAAECTASSMACIPSVDLWASRDAQMSTLTSVINTLASHGVRNQSLVVRDDSGVFRRVAMPTVVVSPTLNCGALRVWIDNSGYAVEYDGQSIASDCATGTPAAPHGTIAALWPRDPDRVARCLHTLLVGRSSGVVDGVHPAHTAQNPRPPGIAISVLAKRWVTAETIARTVSVINASIAGDRPTATSPDDGVRVGLWEVGARACGASSDVWLE